MTAPPTSSQLALFSTITERACLSRPTTRYVRGDEIKTLSRSDTRKIVSTCATLVLLGVPATLRENCSDG